jgi:16S rRNA (cytosine1402-N4)-methyltransferase
MNHIPVLLKESVENLITSDEGIYFEGTVGFGGHTKSILEKLSPSAKLIGTDKDINAFNFSTEKFSKDSRVSIYNTSFTNIETIVRLESIKKLDGIFLDLGVSSYQLDTPESGFTYRENTKFDLRMDKTNGRPASSLVNELSEKELADIIFKYGEEKASRKIAKAFVDKRKENRLIMTGQINQIVAEIIPERFIKKSLSRIYQAFRIAVNNELEELIEFLNKCIDLLNPGGRLAIISFHSLEDRIVKDFFKEESKDCVCPPATPICICNKQSTIKLVSRKPIVSEEVELKNNPRARSAKLRVAEKI